MSNKFDAQNDCECFAIALDAANRTKEACIKATGQKKNIETSKPYTRKTHAQ